MPVSLLIAAALAVTTPQTGNADVNAFLADLAAGRREAAMARILELNAAAGRPNAVALVSELVVRLVRCTMVSASENHQHHDVIHDLRWRCPDGDYLMQIDADYRAPKLVLFEFISVATAERYGRFPRSPPMAAVATGPELSEAVARGAAPIYLDGIRLGGSSVPLPIIFRLHFMDRREPDTFVSPGQLGPFLGPCRRQGEPVMAQAGSQYNGGVVIRWRCRGRGALDANLTTVLRFYRGRPSSGVVLVGPTSDELPDIWQH